MNTAFLQSDLEDLEKSGMYRRLKTVTSAQGREIILDGQRVLNFSSNDYLGLANDSRLKEAAHTAIEAFGLGSGASRLIAGSMSPHERLEAELADFKNTQGALVYSSGYAANCGIIPALMDRHGVVLSDKLNHASIIDGIRLSRAQWMRYPHADCQALEEMLKSLPAGRNKLIATDGVFSMDGDKAPLAEIVDLARRYGAAVMVDEAHGFGVLGERGCGLVEELGLEGQVQIQMGTLSKAAGSFGAYVCGDQILREYLINKSRSFIYTTALPPALAEASRAALKIIAGEPQLRRRLKDSGDYLREKLQAMGFNTLKSTTPIIPIVLKDPSAIPAMSKRLLEKGLFVQAIRPPTVPTGTSRLRLTVTAAHTRADLDQLLDRLKTL